MSLPEIELLWDDISAAGMSARLLVSGFCLYFLLNGFLRSRATAALVGAFYAGLLLLLYWIPADLEALLVYPAAICAAALLACRLAPEQQRRFVVFLCITFYALREIAVTVAGSAYGQLYNALIMQPGMPRDSQFQLTAFILCVLVHTGLLALLLLAAAGAIRRAYPRRCKQLTWREFWLLVLPSLAASAASVVLAELRYPLASAGDYAGASLLASVVLAILFACIVGTLALFAQISRERQKRQEQEALAVQMADMRRYVGDLEALYGQLRTFRHDMAGHLETLSGLEQAGNVQTAEAYAATSGRRLSSLLPAVQSGNPVTDVILSSLHLKAEQLGIRFSCSFHFPGGADPFDIGIILHNAAANALEGAAGTADPFVSIRSWRHRQAFMVECTNSCRPDLCLGPDLPETDKRDKENHGFGLRNIAGAAARYDGRCEAEAGNGVFTLTVMLMLPRRTA